MGSSIFFPIFFWSFTPQMGVGLIYFYSPFTPSFIINACPSGITAAAGTSISQDFLTFYHYFKSFYYYFMILEILFT